MSEGVDSLQGVAPGDRPVLFLHRIDQRHLNRLTRQFAGGVRPVTEVVERVIAYLSVGHLHRTVVDAVVNSVVTERGVYHPDGVNTIIGTHVGGVLCRETVGQVDDLIYLSLLEQGRIALTVYLLYLPAYWR